MVHSPIIRPRIPSPEASWTSVLAAAMNQIESRPTAKSPTMASQSEREVAFARFPYYALLLSLIAWRKLMRGPVRRMEFE